MTKYNATYKGKPNAQLDAHVAALLEAEVVSAGYLLIGGVRDVQLVAEQPAPAGWLDYVRAQGYTVEVVA
jgi:hypothetical protein